MHKYFCLYVHVYFWETKTEKNLWNKQMQTPQSRDKWVCFLLWKVLTHLNAKKQPIFWYLISPGHAAHLQFITRILPDFYLRWFKNNISFLHNMTTTYTLLNNTCILARNYNQLYCNYHLWPISPILFYFYFK